MKIILQFFLCLCLFAGCKAKLSSDYMCFDYIKYIDKCPQSIRLKFGKKIDLGMIGCRDLFIYDSLMIISTSNSNGFWSFFSLPNLEHKGDFLLKGNGPNEFVTPPWVGQASFRLENGQTNIYISDNQKGRLLRMHMDKTFDLNELSITNKCDTLPPLLFNFVYIDSTTYLCRTIAATQAKQERFLLKDGHRERPECLEYLNRAHVTPNSGNYNILSAIIKYSQHNNMVVEMPVGLNYLNMYTLDGSVTRTLCIGRELYNIDELQNMDHWERPYTFANLKLYDTFWGVLYIGETNKSFQTKRKNNPKIYLFDWQGQPKIELQLPHYATTFDIDVRNGILYTIDHVTENVYCYEIKNLI